MEADQLGRRLRFAPPQPRVRRLVLADADFAALSAIATHGPLPSSLLYELTRHLRRDRSHLQNRLTEFYNGDKSGALLTRPQQQFASYEARYQHLVYDLSGRARFLLAERGQVRGVPRRSDPFVHRLMCASVTASFEIAAMNLGLRYIPLQDIIARSACSGARASRNPLALTVPGHTVIPDALFGIEYPGTGFRFFALECDRNTESIERRNLRQSAFATKLAGYGALLERQAYKAWWGIPNLHILTVTTSCVHADNILAFVRTQASPQFRDAFAITVASAFGSNWRVPKASLSYLLHEPWLTVAGSKSFSKGR